MKAESPSGQRRLVGLQLHFADGEVATKYVFPFMDESWKVAFFVVDGLGLGPRLLRGALELRAGALHSPESKAKLEPITALPVSGFDSVVHFDPWWVFRGVTGIDRPWVDAVLATNIAGDFNHEGSVYKMHDLTFDTGLKVLEGVVAKDPVFRAVTFSRGDLSLMALRKPPRK